MRAIRWAGQIADDWLTLPRQFNWLAWGVIILGGAYLAVRVYEVESERWKRPKS